MKGWKKGSVTVLLAWSMLAFLTFCFVLIEGVRVYCIRTKSMQAMELAEFSVLSEYQKELFEDYGVFFLDLDYEQGEERETILQQRALTYLRKNIEEVQTDYLETSNFRRATDGDGSVFFAQAVELMKVQSGIKVLEELLGDVGNMTLDSVDLEEILYHSEAEASGILDGLKENIEDKLLNVSLPDISFPSIESLRETVFGNSEHLSVKSIVLSERLEQRELHKGVGEKQKIGIADMQLFHLYLFQNFAHYGIKSSDVSKDAMEYQLEYIISGKESDRKNLENIMWRIFLLRAGGDYLFYHQDGEQLAKAEASAAAVVGFTGNVVLIKLVRELFLIAQAIEDGIQETKTVFAGGEVPLYENGVFAGTSIGYQQYLYLFLNTVGKDHKMYRCMDVIELEVRKSSGYEKFCLDHCIDLFDVEWNYRFQSLFQMRDYENTIKRKINYEM